MRTIPNNIKRKTMPSYEQEEARRAVERTRGNIIMHSHSLVCSKMEGNHAHVEHWMAKLTQDHDVLMNQVFALESLQGGLSWN